MRQDLTDITLVVDRSGSMAACQGDAEGGINALVKEQAAQDGAAVLTLVQFDTQYEFVHTAMPIKDVPAYKLHPRGLTALLDAVGQAINQAGERFEKMDEKDRPGLVVFAIVTDGRENASLEFTLDQIKGMIDRQKGDFQWKFMFLGADASAFAQAGGMGIDAVSTSVYDAAKHAGTAYQATSQTMSLMRGQTASGDEVSAAFSDEQRKAMR